MQNQFIFSHELYKGYENYEDFLLSYPFVPYQFKLISDVFDAFSKLGYVDKGVKNSERSILGITHYTIGKQAENNSIGYFVPFDAFFNGQFRKNLTNSSLQIIKRALDLDFVEENSFEQRVVFVLFMISNLLDEMKIIFPTNLDNLTALLLNQPDVNRLELQNEIQGVLDRLLKNNIIREEDGQYHFFKEDEIEVANLIQSTTITTDDRLTRLQDIFVNMVGLSRKFTFENNSFNLSISFDDTQIYPAGDVNVKFSFFDGEDIHQRALGMNKSDMVICLNVPLNQNNALQKSFINYVKTAKYMRQNSDQATGTRKLL